MTRGSKKCTKVYTRNRYYLRNSERLKARSRSVYKADPSKKKAAVAALYNLQPKKKIESNKAYYCSIKPRRNPIVLPILKAKLTELLIHVHAYRAKAEKPRKVEAKACYSANPQPKHPASRTVYRSNPEAMKETCHAVHRDVRLKYFSYTKRVNLTKARYSLTQLLIEKWFRLMPKELV